MRLSLFLLFCLSAALPAAADLFTPADELPPYLPPVQKFKRAEVIAPGEVRCGSLRPAAFRRIRSLDGVWKISGVETAKLPFASPTPEELQLAAPDFDDSKLDSIEVPGNYFHKYKVQSKLRPYSRAWYRREFELKPEELAGKRLILQFNRVAYEAIVYLNGREIGRHHGSFTPFEVDATAAAKPGRNLLAVRVLSDNGPVYGTPFPAVHTYGSHWWLGLIPGGITGRVTLSLEPETRITRALITPDIRRKTLRIDYEIDHHGNAAELTLRGAVSSAMRCDANAAAGTGRRQLSLKPGINRGSLEFGLVNPKLWTLTDPQLYFLTLSLEQGGRVIDSEPFRFGYREFQIRNRRFELNGEPVWLAAENISSHQFSESMAPEELEKRALDTLLGYRNRGYIILRTSHMPIADRVLELADECGVMIASEWGWAFVNRIDREKFPRVNNPELAEHVLHLYNHPSVTLWSLGNEVSHLENGWISGLHDLQVQLVRNLDRQKRPVSSFSGSAGVGAYGYNRLNTDLVDWHTYIGLSSKWVDIQPNARENYQTLLKIYAPGKKVLPIPQVAWETGGFSWGFKPDSSFQPGDVDAYWNYAQKMTSWGKPDGIGFSGSIGLAAALDPRRGQNYAQAIYMHRIHEGLRLSGLFQGLAPWHTQPDFDHSTLWTQPVYPALTNDAGLFPRNLFAGGESPWQWVIINSAARPLVQGELRLSLADRSGRETAVGSVRLPRVEAFETGRGKYTLKLPDGVAGFQQLRLTLFAEGKEIARNYYNLSIAAPAVRSRRIDAKLPVVVWNSGNRTNVEAALSLLRRHGINAKCVDSLDRLSGKELAIVPPEVKESVALDLYTDPAVNAFCRKKGGTLLILEQQNPRTRFPGGQTLLQEAACFVDLVVPEHPLFAGLDQRNFDTWNNTVQPGLLLRCSLSPFPINSVAAKGVMLGNRSIGGAIIDAEWGNGHLIISQLDAVSQQETDSSAARYLVNLLSYASSGTRWKEIRPMMEAGDLDCKVAKSAMQQIDLAPYANRSFSDEEANDGRGGWTDQGKNDFRTIPTGEVNVAGILFNIIDPAKNGDRSCLVLRGSARPGFPEAIRGIRVDAYVSRLFFLHTSAWGSEALAGGYRIHYEDGSSVDYVLHGTRNIADWWRCGALPEARAGIIVTNSLGRQVGSFLAEWVNPHPEKRVKSFDFLSAGVLRKEKIDYLPGREPVPVLIAACMETNGGQSVSLLSPKVLRRTGPISSYHLPDKGSVALKDGTLRIRFPKVETRRTPGAILFLKKEALKSGVHTLSFDARTKTWFRIKLVLPGQKWVRNYTGFADLIGDGQFHHYRLRFGSEFRGGEADFRKLLGEFFIHYQSGEGRDGCELEIRNLRLE